MTLEEIEALVTKLQLRIDSIFEDSETWSKIQTRLETYLKTQSEADKEKLTKLLQETEHPKMQELRTMLEALQRSFNNLSEKSGGENPDNKTNPKTGEPPKKKSWI